MDGGDADVVDAPLDADDAAARDIDAASALANFASPLKCITVAARWPSQPRFGSFYSILRRSNGLPTPRFLFLEGARSLRRVQAADVSFAWLEVQQTSQHRKALHSTDAWRRQVLRFRVRALQAE